MCELFKSDNSRPKKYWRKLETVCSYISLIGKVFANFNTWAQDFLFHSINHDITSAYFSFITSLRNIANVVLGSLN